MTNTRRDNDPTVDGRPRVSAFTQRDVDALDVSRRGFLKLAGLGAAGGMLPISFASADDEASQAADVLVVGTGAAGLTAAITAHDHGANVVIIEKAPFVGGTTIKSGGVFWVPNNSKMRDVGLSDPREDALRLMARLAYPALYDANDGRFGLPQNEYELIAEFYDRGPEAIDFLEAAGALRPVLYREFTGDLFPDYFATIPENAAPRGRGLQPEDDSGAPGMGLELIAQLGRAVGERGIPVLLNTSVTSLVASRQFVIAGVEVEEEGGTTRRISARRGVVFATGGFSQNAEMSRAFLRGPIYGGCAFPFNQGDLVPIAQQAGAKLSAMNEAWYYQVALEEALASRSVLAGVFFNSGDSSITVDKYGKRVGNEKEPYNERSRVHFDFDPQRVEYKNQLLFYVYDQRTKDFFPGFGGPVPVPGTPAPQEISADSIPELVQKIRDRLATLSSATGGFELEDVFEANLLQTIETYNGYALTGVDLDFGRGETPAEMAFHGPPRGNDLPNTTMFPLSDTGPYYCVILAAGALDTRGGPKIDTAARWLDENDQPIPGLYGAGNCIASPAGQAYWSAGGTLGPALAFGYIAGRSAAGA